MNERKWIDIEPGNYSLSAYEISKKVIHLLRQSQTVQREEDGAVQFWRIKNYLQNQFPQTTYWSDDRWKVCLAGGGGAKRRYQYCTDISGIIVYFRAVQGHSGRNLNDPLLQDNVVRHDWTRGEVPLGSTVDQQPEGKVVRQSQEEVARRYKFFQPTLPIPKPICDRSGQPDITQDVIGVQKCPSEENKNVGVEKTHDRSWQPDKRSDAVHHEIKMLNTDNELIRERIEEDMDFKIP